MVIFLRFFFFHSTFTLFFFTCKLCNSGPLPVFRLSALIFIFSLYMTIEITILSMSCVNITLRSY